MSDEQKKKVNRANFKFIGTPYFLNESNGFKPYEEKKSSSKWSYRNFSFGINADGQKQFLKIYGGHGDKVYYCDKETQKSDSVAFSKRDTVDLNSVAPYSKWVVNLNEPSARYNDSVNKYSSLKAEYIDIKDSNPNKAKELKSQIVDLKKQIDEYKENYHEFITAWDFAEWMNKNQSSFKNIKVGVSGDIDFYCSKGTTYTTYSPKRIWKVAADTPEQCEGTMVVFYNSESLQDLDKETNTTTLSGFVEYRDPKIKPSEVNYAPIDLIIKGQADPSLTRRQLEKFKVKEGKVKAYGVVFKACNGASKRAATEAELTEELKLDIELGEITLEQAIELMPPVVTEGEKGLYYKHVSRAFVKGPEIQEGVDGYSFGWIDSKDIVEEKPEKSKEVNDIDDDFDDGMDDVVKELDADDDEIDWD